MRRREGENSAAPELTMKFWRGQCEHSAIRPPFSCTCRWSSVNNSEPHQGPNAKGCTANHREIWLGGVDLSGTLRALHRTANCHPNEGLQWGLVCIHYGGLFTLIITASPSAASLDPLRLETSHKCRGRRPRITSWEVWLVLIWYCHR